MPKIKLVSFSDARRNFLDVRLVPFSAPGVLNLGVCLVPDGKVKRGILNVSYRQISRSKIIDQGLKARRIEFTYDLNRLLRDVIGCSALRIF